MRVTEISHGHPATLTSRIGSAPPRCGSLPSRAGAVTAGRQRAWLRRSVAGVAVVGGEDPGQVPEQGRGVGPAENGLN